MRLRILAGLALASMAVAPVQGGCKKKEKGSMNRADAQHTGPSSGRPPNHPLSVKWRAAVGGIVLGAPAAAEGLVLVGSLRPGSTGSTGALQAFDAKTGVRRWIFDGANGLAGGVATTPAVAGGLAIVATGAGRLQALHLSSGQPAWELQAGPGALTAPTVKEGIVYVAGEDRRVRAVDIRSGKALWEASARSRVYASPAVDQQNVYVANEEGTLLALGRDGALRWQLQLPSTMPVSIAVAPGRLLIAALSDRSLRAVDLATHRPQWTFVAKGLGAAFPQQAPNPAVGGGLVCVGDGRRLVCLEPSTGAERIAFATDGDVHPPILAGEIALVASRSGQIQALDSAQGKLLWVRKVESRIVSRLLFDDGNLFFVDSTSHLCSLE